MNFKELHEGAEPSMPGAPSGIKIMTPQQFVAKAGDMPDKGDDEEVEEGKPGSSMVVVSICVHREVKVHQLLMR